MPPSLSKMKWMSVSVLIFCIEIVNPGMHTGTKSEMKMHNSTLRCNTAAARMLLLVLCAVSVHPLRAQVRPAIVGAGTVYNLPIGSLHDRFLGSFGGMAYAGGEVSSQWTWVGKFEYFELNTLNTDALHKTVTLGQGTAAEHYAVPLTKLTMKLTAASLTAEAMLNLLRGPSVESHAVVGFGFVNWVHTRGAYYDSLFVDSAATGHRVKTNDLAVPAIRQADWNGTFNVGMDIAVKVADPLWFVAGVDYKLIVGELWQTLDLDLENVAGMQFVSFRIGLRAEF
jgi:hypothetical protein